MPSSLLVVDDERDASDGLQGFLELQGFSVRVAYSGEAALAAVHAAVPDLVLLDLLMPGWDGWETLRRLREVAPTVRVVILTGGLPDRDVERQALKAGAMGILTKPLPIDELPGKIRGFLAGGAR